MCYQISMLPSITLLVDVAMFNGKYEQKCREEWEHLCGNKVYIGILTIIWPMKLKRDRRLTEGETRANKFLRVVRSSVKRAILRLHRFRILKYCPHGEVVTTMMVLVACAADSYESAQVPSQWVQERATASPRLFGRRS
jgi:hypothetical protein